METTVNHAITDYRDLPLAALFPGFIVWQRQRSNDRHYGPW
jgi:hypothetical protein